jgi:hypothetical protein
VANAGDAACAHGTFIAGILSHEAHVRGSRDLPRVQPSRSTDPRRPRPTTSNRRARPAQSSPTPLST